MCSTVPLVILCKCVLIFWQVSSSLATNCSTSAGPQEQPVPGDAIELVLAKLDHLQIKQLEMELGLKERDEEFAEKLQNLETLFHEQSRKLLAQQAACASHEQMRKEISQLSARKGPSTIGQLFGKSPCTQDSKDKGPLQSCKEAPANSSGVYSIKLGEKEGTFDAFCEQNSFGGGWLVIQYRFDGSLDFYRNWTEYRNGFGDINREFWIGLERLYLLTSRRPHELVVEIKDFDGSNGYAQYKEFEIGSEAELYVLKKISSYTGTARDSLGQHIGSKFTTKDRDNDMYDTNCAVASEGAWWYHSCHYANLNGRYSIREGLKSMCWYHYKNRYQGLAYSRMMIREIEG